MSEKTCEECEKLLDKTNFRRRVNVCKVCEEDPKFNKSCSVCKETYPARQVDGHICTFCKKGNWRVCAACGINKTTAHYRRNQPMCKDCESGGAVCDKKCVMCGETKPSDQFRKTRTECLDCERTGGRQYRRNTTKAHEWVVNNRERMQQLSSNWYENNKTAIRKKEQIRLKEDPIFKQIKYYRTAVSGSVRGELKWNKQLKSSFDDFREWLEYCWDKGMDFNNYGTVWNVDHALPLDLLNKTNNEKFWKLLEDREATPEELLFSWYNTHPLTKQDNRTKGSQITVEFVNTHLGYLEVFMKQKGRRKTRTYFAYRKLLLEICDSFYK